MYKQWPSTLNNTQRKLRDRIIGKPRQARQFWQPMLGGGSLVILLSLQGCQGQGLEKAFAPDPQATQWGSSGNAAPKVTPSPTPNPWNFPTPGSLSTPGGGTSPTPPVAALTPTTQFADFQAVPSTLQGFVDDLANLDVLTPASINDQQQALFEPNAVITRATFARWLVTTNNRINRDRPTAQLRLASPESSQPAFADVPPTHPDFPYIQGLAESGYLPSKLTGDTAETNFRPEAPLTRETLLLWKVPLDRQQVLPTVTAAKVKELWGFKDSDRISPVAMAAVAADHQNGDLANIRRFVGASLLFQPQKSVTRAEAAAALWYVGVDGKGVSAKDLRRAEAQLSNPTPSANPNATPGG
jgi:hypothetical protein